MKILVLAHALRAGGGRATCINILNTLRNLDQENDYYVLAPDQTEYRRLQLENSGYQVIYYRGRFGYLGRFYFDLYRLKQMCLYYRPNLIWAMGGLGLTNPPCPQVVSIQNPYVMYESSHIGNMTMIGKARLFFVRRHFRRQLPKTSLVFCQTATMEKLLRKVYGYQGKTAITWKAVSSFSTSGNKKLPELLKPHQEKYKLLYITRYYSHKGLETLVEVMQRFRSLLMDTVLIITIGRDQHPYAAKLLDRIQRESLQDVVINVGPLMQEDLAGYYQNCDALVMPTRLESFSGTYLEAMHFRLPILTSDLDFAREICGDAALYFDPWDVSSILNAILKVKNCPEIPQSIREKGSAQLRSMDTTWEKIVNYMLSEIHSLVNTSGLSR